MTSSREEAMKVNCEKIKIEAEITEWKSVLDSEQNIGMDGPLVDNEGYPRNDLDIPKIRMARQKIICLSNDHKEVMKKLASLLEDIHAQSPSENEPVRFWILLYFVVFQVEWLKNSSNRSRTNFPEFFRICQNPHEKSFSRQIAKA